MLIRLLEIKLYVIIGNDIVVDVIVIVMWFGGRSIVVLLKLMVRFFVML